MAGQYVIRCPICLAKAAVDRHVPITHEIKCPGCQRFYKLRNALPAKTASSVLPASTILPPRNGAEDRDLKTWMIVLGIIFLTVYFTREHYHGIDGRPFLGFYFLVFLGAWLGVVLLRWMWIDAKAITLTGFLVFEGIGGARLVEGLHQGMQRFGLLITMMVIGGWLFFLRSEHLKSSGRSSGRSNSSCSSGGCGSGSSSGCGGGCGGCGG